MDQKVIKKTNKSLEIWILQLIISFETLSIHYTANGEPCITLDFGSSSPDA